MTTSTTVNTTLPTNTTEVSNDLNDTLWAMQGLPEYNHVCRQFAKWCALQNIELIKPYCSVEDYNLVLTYLSSDSDSDDLRLAASTASTAAWAKAEEVWSEEAEWSAAWAEAAGAATGAAEAARAAIWAAESIEWAAEAAIATAAAGAKAAGAEEARGVKVTQEVKLKELLNQQPTHQEAGE